MKVLVAHLCPILCDPLDCSLQGSSVHGILQAKILEWVAITFSRGIFPAQGVNKDLSHCKQIPNCLKYRKDQIGSLRRGVRIQ